MFTVNITTYHNRKCQEPIEAWAPDGSRIRDVHDFASPFIAAYSCSVSGNSPLDRKAVEESAAWLKLMSVKGGEKSSVVCCTICLSLLIFYTSFLILYIISPFLHISAIEAVRMLVACPSVLLRCEGHQSCPGPHHRLHCQRWRLFVCAPCL